MNDSNDIKINCKDYPASYDMDDFTPLSADQTEYVVRVSHEPLKSGLKVLNTKLRDLYLVSDLDANIYQTKYKTSAKWAIGCGFFSVLIAVIQFCFLALDMSFILPIFELDILKIFPAFEVLMIVIASIAVFFGFFHAHQRTWLINRHVAEQCRLLKYRYLLSRDFWNCIERQKWEKNLNKKIKILTDFRNQELSLSIPKKILNFLYMSFNNFVLSKKNDSRSLFEDSISNGDIPKFPAPGECSFDKDSKLEFITYYQKKRLQRQRHYYFCTYEKLFKSHQKIKKIPHLLFLLSFVAVLAHFIIDTAFSGPISHDLSIFLIALAVLLPFIAAVIKTKRDTFQVSKSAYLYHQRYSALKKLEDKLTEDIKAIDENWNKILNTLWECENFLEGEHRQWLILMHDSDWYL